NAARPTASAPRASPPATEHSGTGPRQTRTTDRSTRVPRATTHPACLLWSSRTRSHRGNDQPRLVRAIGLPFEVLEHAQARDLHVLKARVADERHRWVNGR